MPGEPASFGTAARPSIVVVGGGVAGLLAARDLARAGADVTLVEAEPVLGGRLRRAELAGIPIDIGAEAFATRGGTVQELLAELGLAERVVQPSGRGAWLVGEGFAVPLPEAGALGIPARPLSRAARRSLGIAGALRAAVEPLLPRAIGTAAPSFGALVRARLGRRVCDRLVAPVALGVYSAAPDHLPLTAVPGLAAAYETHGSLIAASRALRASHTAAGGAVAGLDRGMMVLVDALAAAAERAGVRLRPGASAVSLVEASEGYRIELAAVLHEDAAGVRREDAGVVSSSAAPSSAAALRAESPNAAALHADAVVLAVPERAARALVGAPELPEGVLESPVEVIALLVADARLDAAPRGTGVLAAAGAPAVAKALTHTSAKWPHRDFPAGQHVLRLSYGRAGRAPETETLGDAAAAELALADASALLGVDLAHASLLGFARQRWHNGLPPAPERVFELPEHVVAVGDWVSGSGLASVLPGARAAAAELLRSLASRDILAPNTDRTDRTTRTESPDA